MHNFDTLEKKCKLYYLKRVFYIGISSVLLLGIAAYLFFHFFAQQNLKNVKVAEKALAPKVLPEKEELPKKQKNVVKQQSKQQQSKQQQLPKTTMLKEKQCYALQFFVSRKSKPRYIYRNKKKLTQLGFDCFIHEGSELLHLICNQTRNYHDFLNSKRLAKKYNLQFVSQKRICSDAKKESVKQKRKSIPALTAKSIPKQQEKIASKNTFVLQSKKYDLNRLKQLFNERKNYNLALKIAQKYYAMQDYTQAIKWAKKANSINKTDDASWIIYAKSLYAKKEYKKAKKILQIYTKFENSSQVDKLLSDWSEK